MLIHCDTELRDFNFWLGGSDTVNCLTYEQLKTVESLLTDIYPDGIDETELNDFFWFERETIAEWLNYSDFEELLKDTPPWDE